MKVGLLANKLFLILCATFITQVVNAQFLVDMIDTTDSSEKGLWAVYRKSDHLQISGYFQPQFQIAQAKGVKNYSGGDFAKHADNRFMIRRGRIRFDYAHFNEAGLPQAQVVFQFDGSERGVVIRDFWARYYENKFQLFSLTAGMFARPFGYEINISSSERETPERGRMSQILIRTERDVGAMVSFEPRKKNNPLRLLKFDVGLFNGQGLTSREEYDHQKDLIARMSLKSYPLSRKVSVSGGVSIFQGGVVQNTPYIYRMDNKNGSKVFSVDSSSANVGEIAPRRYRGFDAQMKIKHAWGKTELKGEYWWGQQTGSGAESTTPAEVLNEPYYIRDFNGAFFYLLQTVINEKHMIGLKYDIYDPNRNISGTEVGAPLSYTGTGDVRYNTFGAGYIFFADDHLKITVWYDVIRNEKTAINGVTSDIKDNIFTFRTQFRF